MAISPPSDIVLDVIRAADPARQQVAFERLSRMSAPDAGVQFASIVDGKGASSKGASSPAAGTPAEPPPGLAFARERLAELHPPKPLSRVLSAEAPRTTGTTAKTLQQFEAQVVQTFIEQMMPESTTNTYGEGAAGGIWRSMLAEQIAGEIARNGGLGIKDKVMAAIQTRYPDLASQAGSQAADPVASLARTLERGAAASAVPSRDAIVPLSLEKQFLDTTRGQPSATGRTSIFRQA